MQTKLITLAIIALFVCTTINAEIIHLKNGKKIDAIITDKTDTHIILNMNGNKLKLPTSSVERIEKETAEALAAKKYTDDFYDTLMLRRDNPKNIQALDKNRKYQQQLMKDFADKELNSLGMKLPTTLISKLESKIKNTKQDSRENIKCALELSTTLNHAGNICEEKIKYKEPI